MQDENNTMSDLDFHRFRRLLHRASGICLSENKKELVCNKLGNHMRRLNIAGFGSYYDYVTSRPDAELQTVVNLLTINETHFFREPRHFDFFRDAMMPELQSGPAPRVWSAACSSGEEAYSLAMVLADSMGREPWEVIGSDINTRVLEQAARGCYPMSRAAEIPHEYLQRYCLRGIGKSEGKFIISPRLRDQTNFHNVNLLNDLTFLGEFDVVFLRNVMIYFEADCRRDIVSRIVSQIRPGGWLVIGHTETLNGVYDDLCPVAPAVYCRSG